MDDRNIGVAKAQSGSWLRKALVILVPILILIGFIIATMIVGSMKKKPEVKKRSAPTLAVMATEAISERHDHVPK